MTTLVCSQCNAANADAARFCNRCGKRLQEEVLDPDLERRLYERIEGKLKEKWIAQEVVEKEIAINAASRLTNWAKMSALIFGVPIGLAIGILTFFGVRSAADLAIIDSQIAALKKTAGDLDGQYKPLADELPRLNQIASYVRALGQRVNNVEASLRDFPPCWVDINGKVEYLFIIDVNADSIKLTPAWPPQREVEARALPGINKALVGPLSYADFRIAAQDILKTTDRRDLKCRHFVQYRNSVSDAVSSDRARLMVEQYFYKSELRR